MQALYNTSEKMKSHYLNSAALRKLIYTAISKLQAPLPETLPESIIKKYNFVSRHTAIVHIHFPSNVKELERATQPLKCAERFYIQLSNNYQNRLREQKYKGYVFASIGEKFNGFYKNHLAFELTNAQKKVLREIRADMANRSSNEPIATRRCRQRKTHCGFYVDAYGYRQRISGLPYGAD